MSALNGKEGVCRVEVARVDWNVLQPWQRTAETKSSGTAFVIDGGRLLTNAHVVRSATDIRVRPHGSTRRFPAKVVFYAPDVDLALLEIKGEEETNDFFSHRSSAANTANGDVNDNKNSKKTEEIVWFRICRGFTSAPRKCSCRWFPDRWQNDLHHGRCCQ